MKIAFVLVMTACVLAVPATGSAAPFIDAANGQAVLVQKAAGHWRQFATFNSLPFGLSLDAFPVADQRDLITAFFKQDLDFQAFSGKHPFAVLTGYGEHGDLGMFGGVATAADAFRYMLLRDGKGETGDVAAARQRVLAAIEAWHVQTTATGGDGCVARGVMKKTPPVSTDPAVPGGIPATTPLTDTTDGHWREDRSGQYPDWIWLDSVSRDQLIGYVFAIGVLWDAIADDPDVPQAVKDGLKADATAMAKRLMRKVAVTDGGDPIDLVITDWTGKPVPFHDLNPCELLPGTVVSDCTGQGNGFNAAMGLATVRTAYHIGGDLDVGRWYYEDLIAKRQMHLTVRDTLALIYTGPSTNYSNVNMAATAMYGLCRYESDPDLSAFYRGVLADQFYAPGVDRQPKGLQQSFFDLMYAGLKNGGTDEAAVTDGLVTLSDWPDAPAFDDAVTNCDDAEIASRQCVCLDGTTQLELLGNVGHNQSLEAKQVVPERLRPGSDFMWRSDPHDPNGGGSGMLLPGGDYLAAYYLGRAFQRGTDNTVNLSPFRRAAPGGPDVEPVPEVAEAVEAVEEAVPVETAEASPVETDVVEAVAADVVPEAVPEAAVSASDGGCRANAGAPSAVPALLAVLAGACLALWPRRQGR